MSVRVDWGVSLLSLKLIGKVLQFMRIKGAFEPLTLGKGSSTPAFTLKSTDAL